MDQQDQPRDESRIRRAWSRLTGNEAAAHMDLEVARAHRSFYPDDTYAFNVALVLPQDFRASVTVWEAAVLWEKSAKFTGLHSIRSQ